jgi:hypothetical protein
MDPISLMAIGSAAGAIAPIIGGVAGHFLTLDQQKRARELQNQSAEALKKLQAPSLEDLQVLYKLQSTPVEYEVDEQKVTEKASLKTDPMLNQMRATILDDLYRKAQGGMSDQDLESLLKIQQTAAATQQAANNTAMQNLQQRGIYSSGAEIASRLAASQSSANNALDRGLALRAQQSDRANSALENLSRMQQNTFNQMADITTAQDQINQFNAMNQTNANKLNTDAFNMNNNKNVEIANRQQDANTRAVSDNFNSQATIALNQSNALKNQAAIQMQEAGQIQQMLTGVGAGAGQGFSALGNYLSASEKLKLERGRLA